MLGLKLNHVSKRGHWCCLCSVDFGALRELWVQQQSMALRGKFHGSGGHSNHMFTKPSQFSQVSSLASCLNFNIGLTVFIYSFFSSFFFFFLQNSVTFEEYISLPRETHDSRYCLNGLPSTQQFLLIWNLLLVLHIFPTIYCNLVFLTRQTCILTKMFGVCMSQL